MICVRSARPFHPALVGTSRKYLKRQWFLQQSLTMNTSQTLYFDISKRMSIKKLAAYTKF